MTTRAKLLTILILVVVAGGGFYLRTLMRRLKTPGTQQADLSAQSKLAEAALNAQNGPQQTVTLFFPSNDAGVLMQEPRQMTLAEGDTDRIRQIFLALLEGPGQSRSNQVPPDAELRAAFLAPDGTAYLDLSENSLPLFSPGVNSETLAVYSIVDSLCTNIPPVKRVKFLVQGQEVDTLNGHVDLTQPFVPDSNARPATP